MHRSDAAGCSRAVLSAGHNWQGCGTSTMCHAWFEQAAKREWSSLVAKAWFREGASSACTTQLAFPQHPQSQHNRKVSQKIWIKIKKQTEFKKELETLNVLYGLMYPT